MIRLTSLWVLSIEEKLKELGYEPSEYPNEDDYRTQVKPFPRGYKVINTCELKRNHVDAL